MKEIELRRQLNAIKSEYIELQKQYSRIKYDRYIKAYTDALASSTELIDIISINNLGMDDIRFLAEKTVLLLPKLYTKYSVEILANQAKRRKKNSVRKERRNSKKLVETSAETKGVNNAVDPVADTNSSPNDPPLGTHTTAAGTRHY